MPHWRTASLCLVLCGSVACTRVVPTAPHLLVYPAPGTPYPVFLEDEGRCRAIATQQSTPLPSSGSATALRILLGLGGLALGGLIGAASGHLAPGLALGVGLGVWFGERLGGDREERSRVALQRRYDIAYAQCMAAAGHQVPATWWNPSDEERKR